jgi:hypothetical protein
MALSDSGRRWGRRVRLWRWPWGESGGAGRGSGRGVGRAWRGGRGGAGRGSGPPRGKRSGGADGRGGVLPPPRPVLFCLGPGTWVRRSFAVGWGWRLGGGFWLGLACGFAVDLGLG